MSKMDYRKRLLGLLSLEYNCTPEAFEIEDNTLTEVKLLDGRRQYDDEGFFCMVTLGAGTVITADPCLHPFFEEFIKGKKGHWLFEVPNLLKIEKELNKFSYTLEQSHHMFLPSREVVPKLDYSTRWYYGDDIHRFYGDSRFPNAICEKYLPERPDRMAVVALSDGEIMGMAGCSEDAPGWMQIGIDVLPQFRSRGVGTYLVTLMKNKTLEVGAIPFYGVSVANYHSWNIAQSSGFRPTWVEIGAKPIK